MAQIAKAHYLSTMNARFAILSNKTGLPEVAGWTAFR